MLTLKLTLDTEGASGNNDYPLEQLVDNLLQIPDDNEYGFFIEGDLEYPADIKEKSENLPLCF